jgi:hypothetical protein
MKSLAVLKRVLLTTVGVFAILSFARPAVAGPFYFYTITAAPNWGLGNPQPVASWSALTALNGSVATTPFRAENFVSLSLIGNPVNYFAYDTFFGEAHGFIGADVSVPTAQWTNPAAYTWIGGPAGSGGVAFFNSFNAFTGTFYANELIVLDPASCDASCELISLEAALGNSSGALNPTMVTLDSNGDPVGVTLPGDKEDDNVAADPNGVNIFASGTNSATSLAAETPEAPSGILMLTGIAAGAGLFFRRGRSFLPTA